jgi:alpha-D-ribose 1-methylphosphonate 5-triphosphate synthase subunit PhnG
MALAENVRDETPGTDGIGDMARRQRLLSVLAKAPGKDLLSCWKQTGLDPAVELLRGPESGQVGHAMISGRDSRKAQLVAVIDALAQDPAQADLIERAIVAPLEALAAEADGKLRAETAATRVNFFTMVRGED